MTTLTVSKYDLAWNGLIGHAGRVRVLNNPDVETIVFTDGEDDDRHMESNPPDQVGLIVTNCPNLKRIVNMRKTGPIGNVTVSMCNSITEIDCTQFRGEVFIQQCSSLVRVFTIEKPSMHISHLTIQNCNAIESVDVATSTAYVFNFIDQHTRPYVMSELLSPRCRVSTLRIENSYVSSVSKVDFWHLDVKSVPGLESISDIPSLQSVETQWCPDLKRICRLECVTNLRVMGCLSLETIAQMPYLQRMHVTWCLRAPIKFGYEFPKLSYFQCHDCPGILQFWTHAKKLKTAETDFSDPIPTITDSHRFTAQVTYPLPDDVRGLIGEFATMREKLGYKRPNRVVRRREGMAWFFGMAEYTDWYDDPVRTKYEAENLAIDRAELDAEMEAAAARAILQIARAEE